METRIHLPAPSPDHDAFPRQEESVDLYLVFGPHRGRPIGFLSKEMPAGIEAVTDASLPLNVVKLRAQANALRERAETPLSLTIGLDVLQLVRVVIEWLEPPPGKETSPVVLAAPQDECGLSGRFQYTAAPGKADDYFLHAGKYLAAMEQAVAQDARKRLFFELDKETNENLIRATLCEYAPIRKVHVVELMIELEARARLRRDRLRSGGDLVLGPVTPARRPALEELSILQIRLLERLFGVTDWEQADLEPIFDAIGLFATGNLRLPLDEVSKGAWSCQPSSGYFLFFGEFALLAAESETDAGRKRAWERLAPAFLAMQLPFHEVYGGGSGPTAPGDLFGSHSACNFSPAKSAVWKDKDRRMERLTRSAGDFSSLCRRAADDVSRLWFRDPTGPAR